MPRALQMIMEFVALMALAWAIQLVFPLTVPTSFHVVPFGAKWIVYQGSTTIGDFVLVPMIAALAIGAVVVTWFSKTRNFWKVWRIATVVTLAFILICNFGNQYAHH